MKKRIANWTHQLDQVSNDYKRVVQSLSGKEINWKPGPDQWSIGQVLEHLIIINRSYFPLLNQLHQGTYETPFLSKIGFLTNWIGNMILKGVEPTRKKKISTFTIWEPAQSAIDPNILNQFLDQQEVLKREIEKSLPLLEKRAVIASPANQNIIYTLEKAFDIIVTHEQRHYQQVLEILAALKHSSV